MSEEAHFLITAFSDGLSTAFNISSTGIQQKRCSSSQETSVL